MNKPTNPAIGFFNGCYLKSEDIKIPVDNLAVNRGYGAFDFFGIKNNKPFFGDRHIKRFLNTISLMKLHIKYSENELSGIIQNLLIKNVNTDFYLKLFAIPTDIDHSPETPSSLIIIPTEAPVYDQKLYLNGAKLISKEYRRFLPEAKTTNYLPMVYWYNEMLQHDATDILYKNGNLISETSRGNIFCVKNKEFLTPSKNVLAGVTRSVVIDILNNKKPPVRETDITYNELISSDEVFLSSTTKKIMPVVAIDSVKIGNGKPGTKTSELIKVFSDIQKSW
jgi:branched-subunit amino acid aminotransferase/4-amino-4-deoxychorismate lyase